MRKNEDKMTIEQVLRSRGKAAGKFMLSYY